MLKHKWIAKMKQWQPDQLWALADQVLFSGTSFLTTVWVAQTVGIAAFGQYAAMVLYQYLLLSMTQALITGPFQVLQARQTVAQQYAGILLLLLMAFVGLLVLLTGLLFQLDLPFLLSWKIYAAPFLVWLGCFLLHDFMRRYLLAMGKARQACIIDAISGLLQLLGLACFAYWGPLNLTVALWVIALTYLPALVAGFLFIQPQQPCWQGLRNCLHLHLLHGKWLLLTAVLQWCANNFLLAAGGVLLGIKALGALRLAQTLLGVLNALLQLYENRSLPKAACLLQESASSMQRYLRRTGQMGLLLMLPILLACFLMPQQLFAWTGGKEYIEYAYALQGMAILYTLLFWGNPLRIAIRALLLNKIFFTGYLFSFLFSLLCAHYFIKTWQLWGVIAALILNQLFMLGYWQYVLARKNIRIWR